VRGLPLLLRRLTGWLAGWLAAEGSSTGRVTYCAAQAKDWTRSMLSASGTVARSPRVVVKLHRRLACGSRRAHFLAPSST
jgi:hypothetical protein